MDRSIDIRTSTRRPMSITEQQMIEEFWRKRQEEIEAIEDFGERAIPMTRLKRLICAEKGKMMMTFDTPSFLTKACELFVQEIAFRAWICAKFHNRSIILGSDIAEAIASTESLDFLKDIVHNHEATNPKPSKKLCLTSTDLPSTSHQPPPYPFQMPRGPPYVTIPPLPPTNARHMPLHLPFLHQHAPPLMATTLTPMPVVNRTIPPMHIAEALHFLGRNITNRATTSVVINPLLQALAGALPNIPNTYRYINTAASTSAYGVGGASTSNVAAHGGVAFYNRYNPSRTDNIGLSSTHRMTDFDHVAPEEATETRSAIYAYGTTNTNASIDPKAPTSAVCDDQQQHCHEEETNANAGQYLNNPAHGSSHAQVDASAGVGVDDLDINWDIQFPEDVIADDEQLASLPDTTSDDPLLPLDGNMPDLEGLDDEPYLLDDIVFGARAGRRRS